MDMIQEVRRQFREIPLLRPAHSLRIVRLPVSSTGTGAWRMQWRACPSGAYWDQKRFSWVLQAANSCGITVCQWSDGNTTGNR